LTEGNHKIIFTAESDDITIEYFTFIQHFDMQPCKVIEKGNLILDTMQILGHKGSKSMIHKYSGFTCAENEGMAFLGEAGMGDYKVSAVINRNNRNSGDASILIRATKESWFSAQVKESLFGYRIRVTVDGVHLYRENYGEEQIAYYALGNKKASQLILNIEAQKSRVVICVKDKPIITFTDPKAYLYGKVGIEATGEGFGFEYFSIVN
jgi:hypothetical protein